MNKRVYFDLGNGYAAPMPLATTPTGETVEAPLKSRKNVPISRVHAEGCKCMTAHQVAKNSTGDILQSESAASMSAGGARVESPGNRQGGILPAAVHQITLNNTGEAAAVAVVGDAIGLISNYKSIPTLPVAVTVGGTWGTDTLTIINAITKTNPVDYHGIHVQASDENYYAGGNISTAIGTFDNSGVTEQPVNFQMLTSDMSQNLSVRRDKSFRWGLFGSTAVLITIPAGESVTVTFGLNGVGTAQLIQKYAEVKL